jgi:membrane complex biogenesis BtpA family protein
VPRFDAVFATPPLIGVVHLPPLPGYPGSPGMSALVEHALADLDAFARGGLAGVLVENENDRPHRILAERETVASMTAIARELVRERRLPVGVEILLNDPEASIAAALGAGAAFVRSDYFVDRMHRPGLGDMRIDPEAVMAYRARIGADHVLVLADVQVKYAHMCEPRPLAESARLAAVHGADAIVVTGTRTGEPPQADELRAAAEGAAAIPVLVGSGLAPGNAGDLLAIADGAIVGTSLLAGGRADPGLVEALVAAARA